MSTQRQATRSKGATTLTEPSSPAKARAAEIRDIAAALFERAGYSLTTVKDVADAAGVLPGSLYHHFDSKESIAVAIVEEFNRELAALAAGTLHQETGGSAVDDLHAFSRAVSSLSLRHAAAVRIRAHEAPSVATERMREVIRFLPGSYERAWRGVVARLIAELGADTADEGLLRFALQTATLNTAIAFDPSTDAANVGGLLGDLVVTGLATDPPHDADLDNSTPRRVATGMIATWGNTRAPAHGDQAAIRAAARSEFSRRGYDATTIRDIAATAGVGMSTLYRRIESKQQLLEEILQDFSDTLGHTIRAVLTSDGSEPEQLDAVALVLVRARRRFREESEILALGGIAQSPSAETAADQPFHTYFLRTEERLELLRKVVSRGVRAGTLNPLGKPTMLAALLRTIWWLPYQDVGRSSEARAHRFLRTTLIRGLGNPRAR